MGKPPRSPIAEAYHWVSIVTTVCLEMLLPVYLGSKADERWGTGSTWTIAGAALGMVVSISHLMQVTREPPDSSKPAKKP